MQLTHVIIKKYVIHVSNRNLIMCAINLVLLVKSTLYRIHRKKKHAVRGNDYLFNSIVIFEYLDPAVNTHNFSYNIYMEIFFDQECIKHVPIS